MSMFPTSRRHCACSHGPHWILQIVTEALELTPFLRRRRLSCTRLRSRFDDVCSVVAESTGTSLSLGSCHLVVLMSECQACYLPHAHEAGVLGASQRHPSASL